MAACVPSARVLALFSIPDWAPSQWVLAILIAALVVAVIALWRNSLVLDGVNRAGALFASGPGALLGVAEVACPALVRLAGHSAVAVAAHREEPDPRDDADDPARVAWMRRRRHAAVTNDAWQILLATGMFALLFAAEASLMVLTVSAALGLKVPVPSTALALWLAVAYLVALAAVSIAWWDTRAQHADGEQAPKFAATHFGPITARLRTLLHRVLLGLLLAGLVVAGLAALWRLVLVVQQRYDFGLAATFLGLYALVIAAGAMACSKLARHAPGLLGLIVLWLTIVVLWLGSGLSWLVIVVLEHVTGFLCGLVDVTASLGEIVWRVLGRRAPRVPARLPRPPVSRFVDRPAFIFNPGYQPVRHYDARTGATRLVAQDRGVVQAAVLTPDPRDPQVVIERRPRRARGPWATMASRDGQTAASPSESAGSNDHRD